MRDAYRIEAAYKRTTGMPTYRAKAHTPDMTTNGTWFTANRNLRQLAE